MPIIDAQIHLWRTGIGTPPHQTAPYLLEDAIRDMDAAGVDGAVIHPPASWDPASNEQAVEAVQAWPDRFRILAYPPLDLPESPGFIRDWKERPGVRGFRFYFNKPENRTWPIDGTLDWLWPVAEEAGMPDDLARQARPVGTVSYLTERAEGLRHDVLFNYDIELPMSFEPMPTDGEVDAFYLWPIDDVIARIRETDDFKFNAALVIIDFAVRHGVLKPDDSDYIDVTEAIRVGRFSAMKVR